MCKCNSNKICNKCKQPQPHKWAKEIKAWADGAEIEAFCPMSQEWEKIKDPFWSSNVEYRIKPETKTCTIYINLHTYGFSNRFYNIKEIAEAFGKSYKSYIKTVEVSETVEI